MGIFSFIKNAGAKVFGIGKTDAEEAAEALEAKRKAEAAAAEHMMQTVKDLQLEVENLEIHIEGDIPRARIKICLPEILAVI